MANFEFAQLQPFSIYGGGALAGATSVILKSFTSIDGVALAMTDFGLIGFGTLEPGNGALEEQISFTGVTQNSNGTATLTGVKSVLFLSPYTASSGLQKTHAGSTTFVISNTSGYYDQFAVKANDETITGTWTFDTFPITPDNSLASTTVAGIVQESTNAQVLSKTQTGSTGAELFVNPLNMASTLLSDYKADTGSANAYIITPVPAITAYTAGQIFTFKAANANTGASTLVVNGLAAKTIINTDGTALTGNEIVANQLVQVQYDGTSFQLMSYRLSSAPSTWVYTANSTWTKPVGLKYVVVEAVGGGGGGGGTTTSTQSSGGGAGGGYCKKTIVASVLGTTESVGIGAAGAAGASGGGAGGAGGNTTFGSHFTAGGGGGGAANTTGGTPGAATGATINIPGGGGGRGAADAVTANSLAVGGNGGDSLLGLGAGINGVSGATASAGTDGGLYGGGGSGATAPNGADTAGGAGAAGLVLVTEYYI